MYADPDHHPATIASLRRQGARGPWLGLLAELLRLAGGRAELLRHAQSPWASVTFTGSRHTVALAFTGAEAIAEGEALIVALPDHEFAIPGQLVADATIASAEHDQVRERLTVEAQLLLLEEC